MTNQCISITLQRCIKLGGNINVLISPVFNDGKPTRHGFQLYHTALFPKSTRSSREESAQDIFIYHTSHFALNCLERERVLLILKFRFRIYTLQEACSRLQGYGLIHKLVSKV